MGPRKKIKMSKQTEPILQKNTKILSACYLCKLPNEILAKIYQYLSPVDLLSLAQLDQRFLEVVSCSKEVNFSSCRKVNFAVSSLFSKLNVKQIQVLNFNYNIFVRPLELTELICRCKNLKRLSVIESGIKYNHIVKILRSCAKLEELSWDVSNADRTLSASCPTLKTLYLFCVEENVDYSIYLTIMNFPQVKNVFINFAPDLLAVYPYHGAWVKLFIRTICSRTYTVINSGISMADHSKLFKRLSFDEESESKSSDIDILDNWEHFRNIGRSCINENESFTYSSNLQFQSKKKEISSLLSNSPFNAYSSVSIILTDEIEDFYVSRDLVRCLKQVAGDKLKHLTLQFEGKNRTLNFQSQSSLLSSIPYKLCEVVCMMLLSCPNITVLNLANVHFHNFSPFAAICQLQNLRTLIMPSCCLENYCRVSFSWSQNSEFNISMSQPINENLEEVVKNCPKVEKFSLICCNDFEDFQYVRDSQYRFQISQDKITFVKEWKELKHLTIYYYDTSFQTFKFLRKIADSCKQLESLSLILIAALFPRVSCPFTIDVIYVLKAAKNLSFIRLNDPRFNPMFECFFASIEEAVNLEGICIVTKSTAHVVYKTVLKAINKLKYLHLFHFCHPRVSENLFREVKKSMTRHGVKNMKIESNFITADKVSLYKSFHHEPPNICCGYMHLKNIDI